MSVIDLTEKRAIVTLPENCVEVLFSCKVYDNGEIIDVSKKLNLSEIQAAFSDADLNYIDDDDKFEFTEKGKAYINQLEDL